jgi:hypothetical protein
MLAINKRTQTAETTQCYDHFQPELLDLQKADSDLQKMHHFQTKGEWPPNVSKSDANYLQNPLNVPKMAFNLVESF